MVAKCTRIWCVRPVSRCRRNSVVADGASTACEHLIVGASVAAVTAHDHQRRRPRRAPNRRVDDTTIILHVTLHEREVGALHHSTIQLVAQRDA
jgi:hypothetical protein